MKKNWGIDYLDEVNDDLKNLDNSVKFQVLKIIKRVSKNPLPQSEGGYGKLLSNKSSSKLAGCLKIKLKKKWFASGLQVSKGLRLNENHYNFR